MLDYSFTLTDFEGIVRFKKASARYIPEKSGIYRIVVVPASHVGGKSRGSITSLYVSTLNSLKLDVRRRVSAKFARDVSPPALMVRSKESRLGVDSEQICDKALFRAAPLFPPIYIGQARVLRSRFIEHETGSNSHIRNELKQRGLSEMEAFFHWHLCAVEELDLVESLLIQAHLPILNRKLR